MSVRGALVGAGVGVLAAVVAGRRARGLEPRPFFAGGVLDSARHELANLDDGGMKRGPSSISVRYRGEPARSSHIEDRLDAVLEVLRRIESRGIHTFDGRRGSAR